MKKILLLILYLLPTYVSVLADNALADSIVKYQMASGGWPKNQNWLEGPDQSYMAQCFRTGVGSTIDNGATVGELRVLAKAIKEGDDHDGRYYTAFVRGVQYLLNMQYDNGGWPQFFPLRSSESYASHITFNDNAMVRVMRFLWDVARQNDSAGSVMVPSNMRQSCRVAFWKGVRCILDCQIRNEKGQLTVWCQQHDEHTLLPASARKYELASYCGMGETTHIIQLLMDLRDSAPDYHGTKVKASEIRQSISSAVQWLRDHAIRDMKIERYTNAEGKSDLRMVSAPGAPLLWARYYDLKTEQPLYSDRRGLPLTSFNDIEYERRNGYAWVGTDPAKVIAQNSGARSVTVPADNAAQSKPHTLIFQQEFSSPLDSSVWQPERGFVRNHEAQWYQGDNAYCKDGVLIIEARKEQRPNPAYSANARRGDWRAQRQNIGYTSASITTRQSFSFLYGRLEVRAKIPVASGSWPAIWLLGSESPWPSCGEIDVMEFYRIRGVPHILANACWGTDRPYDAVWNSQKIPFSHFTERDAQWADKFHVWRMDWTPESICIYLDDELLNTIDLSKTVNGSIGGHRNPFHSPQYILLNLALGGDNGGPIDDSAFPLRYEIDYVRVYELPTTK